MKNLTAYRVEKLEAEFKGKSWPGVDCRNKRPATGWAVVGHSGYTRAIIAAGLPITDYWSGSNPTPSSQAPKEIVDFCYKNL